MVTAADIIEGGLRLINVPGRGASLSASDLADGLAALKDIISSASVSKSFVPGIRTQFYALTSGTDSYTLGPGAVLDTSPFGGGVPIKVEDAYIRANATITSNQKITNGNFSVATGWTLGANWSIAGGKMTIGTGGTGVASQSLTLAAGTYVLKVGVVHRASSVAMRVLEDATPVLSRTLNENGDFEYEFTISGGSTWTIDFTANATSDLDFDNVSIIERGKDEQSLSSGSDYILELTDQSTYNRLFSKGDGGRPCRLLFSRGRPFATLKFDNAALSGDILVIDVVSGATAVSKTTDTVEVNDEAVKWLKYRLAFEMAGQYGKELSASQMMTMKGAYSDMAAGNHRINRLRPDPALVARQRFSIDRGDP